MTPAERDPRDRHPARRAPVVPLRRPPLPAVHTVQEVADMLRVSKMAVYRLVNAGRLRAYRLGRSIRIRDDDLRDYLDTADTTKGLEP